MVLRYEKENKKVNIVSLHLKPMAWRKPKLVLLIGYM